MKLLKHKIRLPLLTLLAALFLYACSKKGDPKEETTDTNAKNRKEILENLADNVVIPAYANFKVKLDEMVIKSNEFTATPNAANLTAFRSAWVDAYTEWQKVELFDFGPAQTEALRSYVNIYPANEKGINDNIAAGSTVNLEFSTAIATQGFPAIDYLINGLGTNDATILTFYTSASDATKRIDYLKRIVTRINTLFTKVNADWTTYRSQFVSRTGTDANSSMAVVVNSYVLNYERFIRSGKFGIPSGAMMNGVVAAEKVEGFYKKDISLAFAKAAQQASIDFFIGKSVKTGVEGPSFKTYLDALGTKDSKTGTKLTQSVLDQFNVASSKVNMLSPNFYTEVTTNNQKMIDVYTEMQKVVRMLKVDMTSALSITITYTDNDGD